MSMAMPTDHGHGHAYGPWPWLCLAPAPTRSLCDLAGLFLADLEGPPGSQDAHVMKMHAFSTYSPGDTATHNSG